MENLTGRQFGPYRIIAPLGEGGMAAVYKAYQASMDRYVALKVLPRWFAGDPDYVTRFQQEAHVLARLRHPYILPVHDYGTAGELTYIVMPFVSSGTLEGLMKDGPLSLEQMQQVIFQVGDALDYAHSQGIIHRDIKPSNILLDPRGNCLLTDFGIAKIVAGTQEITRTGGIIGTPQYMSPEQIEGKTLDGRSDMYSLGVVLYQMATGRPPFQAETPPAIMVKHLHDSLPPPSHFNANIPADLEKVILKSLAKQPAERYPAVHDMVAAMQAVQPDSRPTVAVPMAAQSTVVLAQSNTATGTAPATKGAMAAPQPPLTVHEQEERKRSPWMLPVTGCLIILLLLVITGAVGALVLRNNPAPALAAILNGTNTPTATATLLRTLTPTPAGNGQDGENAGGLPVTSTKLPTPTMIATTMVPTTDVPSVTPSATPLPPSLTFTPLPPTFTPTLVPPTFTLTPEPPTFTPTATFTPLPTDTPTPTPTQVGLACGDPLPNPAIFFSRVEDIDGSDNDRYWIGVSNSTAFPAGLFDPAPELPPCGANTNASRTWVDIYDGNSNTRIYGYCGLSSMADEYWFAAEPGTVSTAYIVLEDRECGVNYTSNVIAIP